jgi:hypothetical protein
MGMIAHRFPVNSVYIYIQTSPKMYTHYLSICACTDLVDLGGFFRFLIYTQSVGLLGGGAACHKAATYTQNNTNPEDTHTNIHASSGIRTDDPSVRAG